MKSLFFFFIIIMSSNFSFCQSKYEIKVGGEQQKFKGVELLPDSLNESSYYNISEGFFDYFYINTFDEEIIEFDHAYCPIDMLDINSVSYEVKENYTVMTIKTKDLEPVIMADNWNVEDGKASKLEFSIDQIKIYIPNEESGKKILKQIKKGKNL